MIVYPDIIFHHKCQCIAPFAHFLNENFHILTG